MDRRRAIVAPLQSGRVSRMHRWLGQPAGFAGSVQPIWGNTDMGRPLTLLARLPISVRHGTPVSSPHTVPPATTAELGQDS